MMFKYKWWLHFAVTFMMACLLPQVASAQNEANFWYFGDEAGLDFNSGSPIAVTNGQIDPFEGSASISDSSGQLLFYTDGEKIYTRAHQMMANGSGLDGDSHSAQAAIILPKLGSATEYYVFTTSAGGGSGLHYSVVDMSLAGGLGAVTTKNVLVDPEANTERVALARHSNNQDVWLLSAHLDGTQVAYLITPAGILPTPVTSSGTAFEGSGLGYMRVSPNGNHVISSSYLGASFVDFFSFNASTGEMTLRANVLLNQAYGVEFSPDSNLAYVSRYNASAVTQFDLNVADAALGASVTSVGTTSGNAGALALGPDGKIYVAQFGRESLSSFDTPNGRGAASGFQLDSVSLDGQASFAGLPTFPSFLMTPLPGIDVPVDGSSTNDPTPTISGTVNPGSLLTVTITNAQGVVQAISPVVSADGAWTFDASPLIDGEYTVNATSPNANGVMMSASPVTFTVDTAAPILTTIAPINGSLTNDPTPTLTGTGEVGADVMLVLTDAQGNTVQTITVTPDASGGWTADATTLSEGIYTLTANSTDAAGNIAVPVSTSFRVDLSDPIVSLTRPADGSFTNDSTPNVRGNVEPGSTLSVTVLSNGATLQSVNVGLAADGGFSGDVRTGLIDGTYTIRARAVDAAGNISVIIHTFTVDTVDPTVAITSPVNGASIGNTSPTLTGTVESTLGTTLMVSLTNSQGAMFAVPSVNNVMGSWSALTTILPEGTYTINATATDAAGNNATAMSTFTIDTQAPALALVAPANGSLLNDATPTFAGTGEPGLSVIVSVMGVTPEQLTATVDAQGNWSVDSGGLSDGNYTVSATSTDDAGNTTNAAPTSFIVDSTLPTVVLSNPANGLITNDSTPLVSGFSEAGSMLVFEVFNASGVLVQSVDIVPMGDGGFNGSVINPLLDGEYTIVATSTDAAGNSTTDTHVFVVDTMAPVLSVTSPADQSSINNSTPTLTGTSDTMTPLTVTITDANGVVVFNDPATVDAQGNWSINVSATLMEGGYILEVSAIDEAGNTGSISSTFDVDLTGPALSITLPAEDAILAVRDVDVVGITDAETEVIVELKDAQGMIVKTQTVTSDLNGSWAVTFQGVANASYTANASSTDDAGNTVADAQPFSVDSDEPNLTVINPEEGISLGDFKPSIDGTTDADATITVVITNAQGDVVDSQTVMPNTDGTWTLEPSVELEDGAYVFSTTATRPNGKSTTIDRNVIIDTQVPTTTIDSPVNGSTIRDTAVVVSGTSEAGAEVVVKITSDTGEVFSGIVTAANDGNWSVDAGMLPEGDYTIDAYATDAARNRADTSSTFTIDTSAPPVTITSPVLGDMIADLTPAITGTALPEAQVNVVIDGQVVGMVIADDQGQWTYTVTEALDEGAHTVEATTTDEAGNEGTSGEITFDVEDPSVEVVITSPTDGSDVDGPSVVIGGTGEPGSEVTVTVGEQTKTVIVDEVGDWIVDVELPYGEFAITATSGDSSDTIKINVLDPTPEEVFDGDITFGGGGCVCSSNGSNAPDSGVLVMLLLCVGGVFIRRRR